jgi:hypothetical protein
MLTNGTHPARFVPRGFAVSLLLLADESLPYGFHSDHTILAEHVREASQERPKKEPPGLWSLPENHEKWKKKAIPRI